MPSYKSTNNGEITYYSSFYYTNWQGKRLKKMKRGFSTKREAQEFERSFLQTKSGNLEITFGAFISLYREDMKNKIREHTWESKNFIIDNKIMPFFKDKKMNQISSKEILVWQNEMLSSKDKNGNGFSQTYLRSINSQLSAIFNHAVKFYQLSSNPVKKVGSLAEKIQKKRCFSGLKRNIWIFLKK